MLLRHMHAPQLHRGAKALVAEDSKHVLALGHWDARWCWTSVGPLPSQRAQQRHSAGCHGVQQVRAAADDQHGPLRPQRAHHEVHQALPAQRMLQGRHARTVL